jgi:hypothetical protein
VHHHQPFLQRHADVVDEFQRARAGAAFGAIHGDEVGHDAGLEHGLGDAEEFPGVADAELDANRLAAGQAAQFLDEFQQPDRGREGRVHRRRDAIHAHRDAARGGDFRRDLGRRQHAAVAGLGALRQLHLDHLDLRRLRLGREFSSLKLPSALRQPK